MKVWKVTIQSCFWWKCGDFCYFPLDVLGNRTHIYPLLFWDYPLMSWEVEHTLLLPPPFFFSFFFFSNVDAELCGEKDDVHLVTDDMKQKLLLLSVAATVVWSFHIVWTMRVAVREGCCALEAAGSLLLTCWNQVLGHLSDFGPALLESCVQTSVTVNLLVVSLGDCLCVCACVHVWKLTVLGNFT